MIELNFDGLVGPTHHYGGLGVGNLASQTHAGMVSHPRAAALQGLEKIRVLTRMADPHRVQCAILPPPARPAISWLRQVGFQGDTAEILTAASRSAPALLSAAWSASAMWSANAATVTPSCDSEDGRVHLTVSNLSSSMHRGIEPAATWSVLSQIFNNSHYFQVHEPLPSSFAFRDEGAANHMRLCGTDGRGGQHVFVHGDCRASTGRFVPRQGRLASEAVIRQHLLTSHRSRLVAQSARAIDAGAFHNDVVATSCDHLLLFHADAFEDPAEPLADLEHEFLDEHGTAPTLIRIDESMVTLEEAVSSYLFNSQVVPTTTGYAILCPMQCRESASVYETIEILRRDPACPLTTVEFVELRESMHNGGGPACLRLRVMMTTEELTAMLPSVRWSKELDLQLTELISKRYRETLRLADLTDPNFAEEAMSVTAQIHSILGLNL